MRPRPACSIAVLCLSLAGVAPPLADASQGLQATDLSRLQSVTEVRISPDGKQVVYAVARNDRPGRPYTELRIAGTEPGAARPLLPTGVRGSSPRWSPDGKWVAFIGGREKSSLMAVHPDGTGLVEFGAVLGTNDPLPSEGDVLTWSPDGRQIAYVSATPGPETDANGDPMVITRYLYKPTAGEGLTRFNDNRRLHIFVVDVATRRSRQLTRGNYYEHSLAWSPDGRRIAFISNHGTDPDRFFNYDVFTVDPQSGDVKQLTDTRNAEYRPEWSPDGRFIAYLGTKRPLTSSETTMEDTHVWIMNADGTDRREVGVTLDARQGFPGWSGDSQSVLFTAQQRGCSILYRLPARGGEAERLAPATGSCGSVRAWSVAKNDVIAFAEGTASDEPELFVRRGAADAVRLTHLNDDLLHARTIAPVEGFDFKSFDGRTVQAFLTRPVSLAEGTKYPLITLIHGGPHGQQGPAFNTHAQVYANHGYAVLMVNYRGSTGYGQKFADAIFKDQDGGEAGGRPRGHRRGAGALCHGWTGAEWASRARATAASSPTG